MTRSSVILAWFAAVTVVVVGCVAFGIAMTTGSAVVLVGLSLVPPAILMVMWPGVQPPTAAEVLRGQPERRA